MKKKYKKETKYPLTQKQIETLCCVTAYLTIKYGTIIKENSVFTHYEFDSRKAKPEGKIDITYLPYLPNLQIIRIGGYLYKCEVEDGKIVKFANMLTASGVTLCNDITAIKEFPRNINYKYYIKEANKILAKLKIQEQGLFW